MFDGQLKPELDPAERFARIRLARGPRIGPVSFHEALAHFGSAAAACQEIPVAPEAAILREQKAIEALGGRFLVFGDPTFPEPLAQVPDAPPVLTTVGDPALLGRPILAIVGARDASAAGQRFAEHLARALGAAGFVIASGLARGIDAAAHHAALPTGTVAVLAGGADQIYPPQNAALHREIATRGLILAESPPGVVPVARAFPRRNRIVSGLARGVVVIEAAERSGSLITARRAADQGRDVFVMPGSPMDARHAGSNSLIRDGAILVRDENDILSVMGLPHSSRQPVEKARRNSDNIDSAKVLESLGSTPTAVDELVRRCQVSAATVAEVLLALELEGRLERHRGNRVSLI
jgi:DNA processing protein